MRIKNLVIVGALAAVLGVVAIACGDDKTATPAPSTPTAAPTTPAPTETGTATETATATASETASATETASETATETATATEPSDDRAGLIAQFPADVQPLLEQLWSTDLIQLLLDVRNSGPGTIVWQDAGGEFNEGMQRAFNREWEQITGWSITYVSLPGTAMQVMQEQVNAGRPEWDVTEISSYGTALRLTADDMFEPIDNKYFPVEFYAPSTLVNDYWSSVIDYGTILIYNTEVFGDNAPTHINDLFDTEKYPDEIRCLYGPNAQYGWALEYALIADGVAPEEVYTTLATEEGRARAFAKLDTIKDKIVWWESGAESVQFIIDGQCDFGTTWNGRPALRVRDEPDLPLGASWGGAFLDGDPFGIPKGAKNPQAGMSALAYALAPNNQCDLENELAYGQIMSTEPYPDCLTDFAKTWGPDPSLTLPFPPDPEFWVEFDPIIQEEWTAWVTR